MFKRKIQSNYLDKIPTRIVQEFIWEENKITLLVPKFKSTLMQKWFIPERRSKYFRIHLDEMGSKVWDFIDGVKTVEDICNLVKVSENELSNPGSQLEWRITKYLSNLYKNRFIRFLN